MFQFSVVPQWTGQRPGCCNKAASQRMTSFHSRGRSVCRLAILAASVGTVANTMPGTWVHHTTIFAVVFDSMSTSTGRYWVFTDALNWEARTCSSFINVSIKTFGSRSRRCVYRLFSVSPTCTETEIGTCTFSNVRSFVALYILASSR